MENPDLIPSAILLRKGLLHKEHSSKFLELILAQVKYLEKKTNGLLSGRVIVTRSEYYDNYQFNLTVPKIANLEIILFSMLKNINPDIDEHSVRQIEQHFSNPKTIEMIASVQALARSIPIPNSPFAKFNGSGYSDDPDD